MSQRIIHVRRYGPTHLRDVMPAYLQQLQDSGLKIMRAVWGGTSNDDYDGGGSNEAWILVGNYRRSLAQDGAIDDSPGHTEAHLSERDSLPDGDAIDY